MNAGKGVQVETLQGPAIPASPSIHLEQQSGQFGFKSKLAKAIREGESLVWEVRVMSRNVGARKAGRSSLLQRGLIA